MKSALLIVVSCMMLVSCKHSVDDEISPDRKIQNTGITAAKQLSVVLSKAASMTTSPRLKHLRSADMNSDGTSQAWSYCVAGGNAPGPYYYFTATEQGVQFDSTRQQTVGDAFISHEWMDSDRALQIAEANGGSEFRKLWQNYSISASLSEAVVPDAPTVWVVTYHSKDNPQVSITIWIDAVTGARIDHVEMAN